MRRSLLIVRLTPGLTLGSLALGGLALGCARVEPVGEGGGAALMRNLLRAGRVEIVVPPGPAEAACWKAAERIASERGIECSVVAPSLRGDPRAARIVVGGPSCELAVSLLRCVEFEVGDFDGHPSFSRRHRAYPAPEDVLIAVFEDPERPGLPLTLCYGNDEAHLGRCAETLEPGWRPWMQIYRALDLLQEAPLSTEGVLYEHRFVDHATARERVLSDYTRTHPRKGGHWIRYAPDVEQDLRRDYLDAALRARRATDRWTGAEGGSEGPVLVLHARLESMAACARGSRLASWNPAKGEIHALLAHGIPHDGGAAVARARAEESLGPPAVAWLAEGAAVHAAGSWWGRDLDVWIAWLRAGDLAPAAASLVDPAAAAANSPHAIQPMRAALFRFLLDGRGETFVRALWAGRSTLSLDPELEKSFTAWLDDHCERHRNAVEKLRSQRKAGLLSTPFVAGAGIEEPEGSGPADRGGSTDRGFGSRAFETSLAEARAIGARALALTCTVAVERDPPRVPDPLHAHEFGPLESDLRVLSGLCQARASGLRTFLQPLLVTAPGGSLAGAGPQFGAAGWAKFFDGYERAVVHCALLAELANGDGLSLGGGLTATVRRSSDPWRGPPEEALWRRAGWSSVVRSARAAFSGTLLWSADSLVEARELSFWEELDAVGCDLEHEVDERAPAWNAIPLAQLRAAIDQQLAGLEAVAREHGKPLILTRASFRSGAPRPGARRRAGYQHDPGLQTAQLEVLAAAVRAARARGVLQGVFLWRLSSDPLDQGVNGRDSLLRPGPAREAAARVLAD